MRAESSLLECRGQNKETEVQHLSEENDKTRITQVFTNWG